MARVGLQSVSLTSGTYRFETYASGQQVIRGAGGRFVSPKSLGVDLSSIDLIFKQIGSKAHAIATAAVANISEGVLTTGNVQLEISGLRHAIYKVKKLEAMALLLPGYSGVLQTQLRDFIFGGIQRFVDMIVQPKAEEIIDALVYQPSLSNTAARMRRMVAARQRGSQHEGSESFNPLAYENRFITRKRRQKNSRGKYETVRIRESLYDIMSELPGFEATTWGERRNLQIESRLRQRMGRIEARSQSPLTLRSLSLTASREGAFLSYAGATGLLRVALRGGIFAEGTAIHIGINETAFPNKVYWQFVELGHRYVIPIKAPGGGYTRRELPFKEPAKPFLQTLNQWMMTEGKQRLDLLIKDNFNRFMSRVQDNLRAVVMGAGELVKA